VGDLFDVAFKANTRNIKLLEPYGLESTIAGEHSRHPGSHMIDLKPRGTPWRYIVPIAAVLIIALTLVLIGFITVVRWLFGF
jgi:hypothetical protein